MKKVNYVLLQQVLTLPLRLFLLRAESTKFFQWLNFWVGEYK